MINRIRFQKIGGVVARGALALALAAAPTVVMAQDPDIEDLYALQGDAVSADVLMHTPDAYYGKKAFIEGFVQDVHSANVFSINEDSLHHGHEDLLVVIPRTLSMALGTAIEEGDQVELVGVLHKALAPEFEDIGDPGEDVDIEDQPVFVVEGIEVDD